MPVCGGALCVYQQCKQVVDLWGGVADARDGTAWAADTLTLMFSCNKGLMLVLIARLGQDGCLSFDTKVAEVGRNSLLR
ncbi:serine hydrolase domain-containing protein [Yoonia sediminilitoris]|uniref:serine hydrolase domain-containing protein n=1 Tax=Yoonia sediminilitoris TaxID=1286148 RepID=UPI000D3603D8|nr:serine hydrolase domain-containing protein [Yoonia sediminilitoris]